MRALGIGIVVAAGIGLASCSGSSGGPDAGVANDSGSGVDSGVSTDAGTGTDSGTSDAGPTTTLTGSLAFPISSAVAVWQGDAGPTGVLGQHIVGVFITDLSTDDLCATLASGYSGNPVSPADIRAVELVASNQNAAVAPAEYPFVQSGSLLSLAAVGITMNGQTVDFSNIIDGGITLTLVDFPTALSDGWYSGGELDGTYAYSFLLPDGGVGDIAGQFQAPGCPYETLFNEF